MPGAAVDAAPAQEDLRARTAAFSRAIVDASKAGWSAEAVDRIADFYATDTVVFPPRGEPLRGRPALTSYWTRSPERRILSHWAVAERIDVSDSLATEWGTLTIISQQGDGAPVRGTATYISIWLREEGVWRKQMDTWW
jgi:ketosteroid isomerase-like protein